MQRPVFVLFSLALLASALPAGCEGCGGSLTPPTGAGASGMVMTGAAGAGGASSGVGGAGVGAGGAAAAGAGGVGGVISISISIGGAGGNGLVGGSTGLVDGGRPPLGFGCVGCAMTSTSVPLWHPVDAIIFPASLAAGEDYRPLVEAILAPNHARYDDVGVFGPGTPHGPPYEDELYGMALQHHLQAGQNYLHSMFASPGTSLIFMLVIAAVPGGAYGRSTDFASGSIIPNDWFPMHVEAQFIGPPILDPVYDRTIPGYDGFSPPLGGDGPSHFVLAFRTNAAFATDGAPGLGAYDLEVVISDAFGVSWDIHMTFTVYPDEVP